MKKNKMFLFKAGFLALALSSVMAVSVPFATAKAESTEMLFRSTSSEEEKVSLPGSNMTSEDLLEGYMHSKAATDDGEFTPGTKNASVGSKLQGAMNVALYSEMKPVLKEIADGKRNSAAFTVRVNLKDMMGSKWKTRFTPSDLGVSFIAASGRFNATAVREVEKMVGFEPTEVIVALLYDMPYEMYWYDKTNYEDFLSIPCKYNSDDSVEFPETADVKIYLYVTPDYATSGTKMTYGVDTAKTGAAAKAAANANAIITANAGKSDYEKLKAYKDKICELTDYNYDKGEKYKNSYGDPWQMIHVFDGDPSTKVVCEGYAKAFKYLCDGTNFRSKKIECNIVSGYVNGSLSRGHMWNTVRMNDGKLYMVDVTSCDTNGHSKYFLCGGTTDDGRTYTFSTGKELTYKTATYAYQTDREMALSSTDYDPKSADDTSSIAVKVYLYTNGGTCNSAYVTSVYGGTYGSLPTPVRSGYAFEGWFLDYKLTTPVYAGTVVSKTEDHNVFAKWRQLPAPAPTPTPTPAPKPAPSNGNDNKKKTNKLTVGSKIDTSKTKSTSSSTGGKKATKAKYKVTKGNTLEYVQPSSTKAKSVVIPSKVKIYGKTLKVTSIAGKAFSKNSKTKSIVVPSTVSKFSKNAFKGIGKKTTIVVCAKNKKAYKKTVKAIKKSSPNTRKCKFKFKKSK